ncbi:MAG TPA: alpha/beta hydrolase [Pyrinomonadaceae bacterium]|nr:alpha/beta hydrolase [Pyrinomonadaceae bacterium]
MMKKSFIILILSLSLTQSQTYSQTICQNTRTDSAVGNLEKYVYKQYSNEKGKEKKLHIGLTRPVDKLPVKKRPLIIGVHGGGFVDFCPFEPCYVKFSENILTPNFTSRGFMTASVQYRLTAPFDFKPPRVKDEKLRETHYKAVQDAREAIKYIFENAEKLGVDTENVFLIGSSAGAITVLHAAFLDNEETPKDLLEKYGALAEREKIRGVVSLSGALYDLAYLSGGDKVPVMIVHGSGDFIVPFEKGFYLGMKHLTPVYGGKAIFEAAQKQGIETRGFFYDFGHKYPSQFSREIFTNANDFIRLHLTCKSGDLPDKSRR